MVRFSKKLKRLNNLATACANAKSNDFKALWYHKLIDLAKEYNMLDYVMRKVIHWGMTVTDKDAKDFQKMVDKLEKKNKKDKEKSEEQDKKELDKTDKEWYSNSMNIFYLHKDPKICAEQHLDKHVVKMLIEYAQLMSTAHRMLDGVKYIAKSKTGRKVTRYKLENKNEEAIIYKACHLHHPSAVWVRNNAYNYNWLYQMWSHLHDEFKLRYGKDHKSYTLLKDLLKNPPKNIPLNIPFNQPTQAMPDDVKNEDSITAYRDYYVKYKKDFATWKTSIPEWYSEGINANI